MKTEKEIRERLAAIEKRRDTPTRGRSSSTRLAVLQSRIDALRWVLGHEDGDL